MARTVVIPSRAESMPYIVLEAVAAGKKVISTRVGGIPEILGADNLAFVPPGDAEALAHAMAADIADPQRLRVAMPDMEAFRRQFLASVMADRMIGVYQECLREKADKTAHRTVSSLS